ncbi:MAG: hypothetical protein WCS37_22675, partial [Chloroflexota bacterium]|nr:hypothetical protein [Chloroflexota bacterium]
MLYNNFLYPQAERQIVRLNRPAQVIRLILIVLLALLPLIPKDGMIFKTVPTGKGQVSPVSTKTVPASTNETNAPAETKGENRAQTVSDATKSSDELLKSLYAAWMQTQNLEAASDSSYHLVTKDTGEVQGHNPSQELDFSFGGGSRPPGGATSWRVQTSGVTLNGMNLNLTGIGYQGQALATVAPPSAGQIKANRVEYQRGAGLTEWYANLASGLEQGFTLSQAWPGSNVQGGNELALELSLTGGLFQGAGTNLTLVSELGQAVSYGGLYVYDATGRELPSRMEVSGNGQP